MTNLWLGYSDGFHFIVDIYHISTDLCIDYPITTWVFGFDSKDHSL